MFNECWIGVCIVYVAGTCAAANHEVRTACWETQANYTILILISIGPESAHRSMQHTA